MKRKTAAQIGIIGIALAGAAFFGLRNAKTFREDSDFTTRRMSYVCTEPTCGTGFDVSMNEIRNANRGILCPKCSSPAISAYKCAACGKMNVPLEENRAAPEICQFCNAALVVDDPNKKRPE